MLAHPRLLHAGARDLIRKGFGLGLQRLQHLGRVVPDDVWALGQGLTHFDEDGAQALQTALKVLATWEFHGIFLG